MEVLRNIKNLLLRNIDVKIDTDIREKKFTFKWTVQNVKEIPMPARSLKFSLVRDDQKDWFVTVARSEGKFNVSLTCDSEEPIPLRIEHSSKAFDAKLDSLGGTSTDPVLFQKQGDERVLLKQANFPDDDAIIECSLKIYGYDMNTTCELSNSTDNRDRDLVEYQDGLRNLMQDETHADVKITAVGRCFPAHKCVLKFRAPTFFDRHQENIEKGSVVINTIDANIFQRLLEFIYTGEVEQFPVKEDYRKLYIVAHRYALPGLIRRCAKALSAELSVDSVVDVFVLADQRDDEQLKMQCRVFMRSHLMELSTVVKWKNLLKTRHNIMEDVMKLDG